MDKKTRSMFNHQIFDRILSFWQLDKEKTEELKGFESFIYKTEYRGTPAVLKISHTDRRSIKNLEGEIEFTQFLGSRDLRVPEILSNEEGRTICEAKAERGHFTGVLYSYLEGTPPGDEDWNSQLAEKIGRMLGRMHKMTKDFTPRERKRPDIFEEFGPTFGNYLDDEDNLVVERIQTLYQELKSFPQTKENWGMVHVDFHGGNFSLYQGEIGLFDFDDCQYSWFAHDIAMALFYMLPPRVTTEEDLQRGHDSLNQLLSGYLKENSLSGKELIRIPLFLKLREMELYALIKRSFDLNDLDPWCANYMNGRKDNLEKDEPFFPLDLSAYTD